MFREPRLYQDEHDLNAIYDLLRRGRLANNGTYYVHPGDLNWWLFYPPLDHDLWGSLYLWDDPGRPGAILGWALIPPDGETFDVVVQPELCGSPLGWEMLHWGMNLARSQAKQARRERISVYWIAENDQRLRGWLVEQGFELANRDVHLVYDLTQPIPEAPLPEGYLVRSLRGLAEVRERARAQYHAFDNPVDFERYAQRFTRFMESPVYDPECDVVVVAPDGQTGAFCLIWPDETSQVGLFEPVGTHPDHQRKGLGRAVMREGLERLRARGMRQAIVGTAEDHQPAVQFYLSLGFHLARRMLIYKKMIV